MTRRTGEQHEKKASREREQNGVSKNRPARKPRGALFDSGDPTLARQLHEDPYRSRR